MTSPTRAVQRAPDHLPAGTPETAQKPGGASGVTSPAGPTFRPYADLFGYKHARDEEAQ